MSCHTPADNSVHAFVQRFVDEAAPATLDELLKALRTIPEYADGARKGYGPVDRARDCLGATRTDGRGHDRRDRGPD